MKRRDAEKRDEKTDTIWQAQEIDDAMNALRIARIQGDPLKIELAESALNDLIDRYLDKRNGCHR